MFREPINQVGIDRLETLLPGGRHKRKHLLGGLNAVHGFLHRWIKVLNTETQAVEAEFSQGIESLFVNGPGIDLDGILATRRQ